MSDIKTFIQSLGGGDAVATALNEILPATEKRVDREAVYKWVEHNKIPHYRRLYMAQLGLAKGVDLPEILIPYLGGAQRPQLKGSETASTTSKRLSQKSLDASKAKKTPTPSERVA